MNDYKLLAIIPARSGSKGIPGKNIRPFCGKPLIAYSIEAAKGAPSVSRIIVDTDSEEIAAVAKALGAEVPYLRPAELASDSAKLIDSTSHLLDRLKADEGYEPTHVLLLQPTSPMRTSEDIENAVALMKKRGAKNVISVCRTEYIYMTKDENDTLRLLDVAAASAARQEMPQYYKFDGSMIYLIEVKTLRESKSFAGGDPVGYVIERWRGVDLDEPEDFVVGELIYKNREAIAERLKHFGEESS